MVKQTEKQSINSTQTVKVKPHPQTYRYVKSNDTDWVRMMDSAFWVGICTGGGVGVAWYAGKMGKRPEYVLFAFCGGEQQL